MAFPTTGVLDNFTRGNETPLTNGGQWTNGIWFSTSSACNLVSNAVVPETPFNFSSAAWNPATFTDCEEYGTVGATSGGPGLCLRFNNLGGATTGYEVFLFNTTTVAVFRRGGGSDTQIGSSYTIATAAIGDQLGASMVGSTLTTYYKAGAGAWTALGAITDTTYPGPGYLGILFDNSSGSGKFTSFGGGTVVPSAVPAWSPRFRPAHRGERVGGDLNWRGEELYA